MTDDKNIEEVSSFTYLGVVINKHLTWQVHIDYICNEIDKKLFRCLNNLFTHSFDTVFNSEYHDYNTSLRIMYTVGFLKSELGSLELTG